jgi:hypothetical protein
MLLVADSVVLESAGSLLRRLVIPKEVSDLDVPDVAGKQFAYLSPQLSVTFVLREIV